MDLEEGSRLVAAIDAPCLDKLISLVGRNDGVADGFNLMPPVLPEMLDVFIAEVVPLLRRRGIFRTAYEGETLRSHFGLARPPARISA